MVMNEIERVKRFCISLYYFDDTSMLNASDEAIENYFNNFPIEKTELKNIIVNENITTVKELIKIPSIKDLLQYRLQHVNVAGEPTVIINLSKEYPELNMLLKQTMAELRKTQLLKDFE